MSHLLSDGPTAWTCPYLTRDQVREDMYGVIETWNIQSSRNINYRFFIFQYWILNDCKNLYIRTDYYRLLKSPEYNFVDDCWYDGRVINAQLHIYFVSGRSRAFSLVSRTFFGSIPYLMFGLDFEVTRVARMLVSDELLRIKSLERVEQHHWYHQPIYQPNSWLNT